MGTTEQSGREITPPRAYQPVEFAEYVRSLSDEELIFATEELTEIARRAQFALGQTVGTLTERGIPDEASFAVFSARPFTSPRGLNDARDMIPQPEGHYHLKRSGLLDFVVGAEVDFSQH